MDLRTLIVFMTFFTLVTMAIMPVNESSEPAKYQSIESTTPATVLSKSISTPSSTHETLIQENQEEGQGYEEDDGDTMDEGDEGDEGDEQTDEVDLTEYDEANNRTINEDDDTFVSEPETNDPEVTTIPEESNKSNGTLRGSPPVFTQPDSMSKIIPKPSGNMVRMRCAATGEPKPEITWTKDGQPINRNMGQVNFRKWAIILEELVTKDSGHYTCHVCNIHGCIEHTTRLDVIDRVNHKPIFTESPQNQTRKIGDSTLLKCKILSDLHLHIEWLFKNCTNSNCTDKKVSKTDPDNPEELKLKNITHADEGWYTCIAANSLGTTTASAYLKVVDELPKPLAVPENKFSSMLVYIIAAAMGVFFLAATLIIYIGFKKLKHEKLQKHRAMETVHQWTKKVIIVKPSEDECDGMDALQMPMVRIEKQRTTLIKSANDPSIFNEYEFPLDSNWEFSRSQLRLGPTLGEGAFGRVVMAEAHGLIKNNTNTIVAVKMVKEGHTDSDMTSLVREMEVMKMIGKHINIINLLGCCSQDGPLYVIVEYAPHGNLKDFLKKNLAMAEYNSLNTQHVLTLKDLASFAFQVARGMEYLASRRCIHRDLAARNVLVCDDYIVKIADFGLARDLQESDYYRKSTNGRLPIKWMAPESLRDKFYDTQSDVWSYGILLWEIMTFGEQPYPQIYSSEYLYDYLKEGNRMEKPVRCPINIYMLTRQCWNWNPNSRPTFTEIVDILGKVLSSTTEEQYLDLENVPFLDETNSMNDDEFDDEYTASTYDPFIK